MKNIHLLFIVIFSLLLQDCSKKKPKSKTSTSTEVSIEKVQKTTTQNKMNDSLLVKPIDSTVLKIKQSKIEKEEISHSFPKIKTKSDTKKKITVKNPVIKQEEKIKVKTISKVNDTVKIEVKPTVAKPISKTIKKTETIIPPKPVKENTVQSVKIINKNTTKAIKTTSNGSKLKWTAPANYQSLKNPTDVKDKENLAIGKSLYSKHCKSCHGREGFGDGPKAADQEGDLGDFSSEDTQSQPDGALFYKISTGKDDMPNFKKKINDEDRWLIVNYLRTLAE